jgi:multidrug efflux pump subunit AcrB
MVRSRPRRPVVAVFVALLLLGGALLLIGTAVRRFVPESGGLLRGAGETTVTHGVVVEQTRAVAKLVSSETSVRDVVVYQNRRLGSTKRSLVVVTGKVLAGLDLDQGSRVDIDHAAHRVNIVLPPAKVLGVEVTQLRTYDERNGLWNPFRPEDRDTIYQLARDQLVAAAGELGVTAHAEESARRMLGALIHPEGYTVEITFSSGSKVSPGAESTDAH